MRSALALILIVFALGYGLWTVRDSDASGLQSSGAPDQEVLFGYFSCNVFVTGFGGDPTKYFGANAHYELEATGDLFFGDELGRSRDLGLVQSETFPPVLTAACEELTAVALADVQRFGCSASDARFVEHSRFEFQGHSFEFLCEGRRPALVGVVAGIGRSALDFDDVPNEGGAGVTGLHHRGLTLIEIQELRQLLRRIDSGG